MRPAPPREARAARCQRAMANQRHLAGPRTRTTANPRSEIQNPSATRIRRAFPLFLLVSLLPLSATDAAAAAEPAPPDYAAVEALFHQHCLDCHAAQDPEAN